MRLTLAGVVYSAYTQNSVARPAWISFRWRRQTRSGFPLRAIEAIERCS